MSPLFEVTNLPRDKGKQPLADEDDSMQVDEYDRVSLYSDASRPRSDTPMTSPVLDCHGTFMEATSPIVSRQRRAAAPPAFEIQSYSQATHKRRRLGSTDEPQLLPALTPGEPLSPAPIAPIFAPAPPKQPSLKRLGNLTLFPPSTRRVQLGTRNVLAGLSYNVPFMKSGQVYEREFGGHVESPHTAILEDYVSSSLDDIYRFHSQHENQFFATPFAVAYSNRAPALAAVATDEGVLTLLDTQKDAQSRTITHIQAHENSLFDVAWSADDTQIATGSGDQTVRIWDVSTQTPIATLLGHTGTIKKVDWDPYNANLLATAARDGSIRVWDLRAQYDGGDDGAGDGDGACCASVNTIRNAHGVYSRSAKTAQGARSVTSLAYLRQADNLLASAGSADGTVKVWDLRRTHSRRINPAFIESNAEAATAVGGVRAHGVTHLRLSPDGTRLYALGMDSRILAYDPLNVTLPAPLAIYSHPRARINSFYIRTAISPCSRYLACGSTSGNIYLWDTKHLGAPAVELAGGHSKETTCLDWTDSRLISCSDDQTVRTWSLNRGIASRLRAGSISPENYSFAS